MVLSAGEAKAREDGAGREGHGLSAGMSLLSPGRRRTEVRAEPVPKFRFSSLEEFAVKAEASGAFAQGPPGG